MLIRDYLNRISRADESPKLEIHSPETKRSNCVTIVQKSKDRDSEFFDPYANHCG